MYRKLWLAVRSGVEEEIQPSPALSEVLDNNNQPHIY